MWQSFDDRPDFAHYQRLCEHAKRARMWNTLRDKALKRVRAEIKTTTRQSKTSPARATTSRGRIASAGLSFGYFNDASTLVQILLWEKDIDGAWKEAKSGGCNQRLWMELAAKYEKGHPLDVVPLYKDEIERTIAVMNNRSYADAVKLLVHVRKLLKAGGKASEFDSYIQDVRTRHKPKRNLMKLFADHGWL